MHDLYGQLPHTHVAPLFHRSWQYDRQMDADKSYRPRYGQMAYPYAQVHIPLLVLHGTYTRWRLGHLTSQTL